MKQEDIEVILIGPGFDERIHPAPIVDGRACTKETVIHIEIPPYDRDNTNVNPDENITLCILGRMIRINPKAMEHAAIIIKKARFDFQCVGGEQ